MWQTAGRKSRDRGLKSMGSHLQDQRNSGGRNRRLREERNRNGCAQDSQPNKSIFHGFQLLWLGFSCRTAGFKPLLANQPDTSPHSGGSTGPISCIVTWVRIPTWLLIAIFNLWFSDHFVSFSRFRGHSQLDFRSGNLNFSDIRVVILAQRFSALQINFANRSMNLISVRFDPF